ncbi:DUF4197 domain-containing protein [Ekhidna sp.]|uniref:DUF4197 domain-containing protein n=1 Tax=Ekhidna sp. TaxID=2608089 RepID=UPI0032EEA9E8
MKNYRKTLIVSLIALTSTIVSCELFEDATNPLSEGEIIQGLKEALNIGLDNSVTSASSVDGYLKNEVIKILLPEEVANLKSQINSSTILSAAYNTYIDIENDGDDLFDGLITAMNRGAEDAAGTALPIFGNAITNMTFDDARNILNSENDQAATDFFEAETRSELISSFSPNVKKALGDNQASQLYSDIVALLNYEFDPVFGTTVGQALDSDPNLPATLDEYATGKAVDGLFYLVGEEEKKIREDPFAWGSSIIERVFGGN